MTLPSDLNLHLKAIAPTAPGRLFQRKRCWRGANAAFAKQGQETVCGGCHPPGVSDYTGDLQRLLDQLLRDAASGRLSTFDLKRCDDLLFQARHVLEDYI